MRKSVIVLLVCFVTIIARPSTTVPFNIWTDHEYTQPIQEKISRPFTQSDTEQGLLEEHHTTYMPIVYSNATVIAFSNGITFDTRKLEKDDEPELNPDLMYHQGQAEYHIVQFSGPVYEEQKQWLEDHNAVIHMFVPRYGFVCRMNSEQANVVQENSRVNWVGVYQPAYKISSLFEHVEDEHCITILLFNDADIHEIVEQVKNIARHEEFETSDNGINKMIFGSMRRTDVAVVAHIPGVYWIEPYIQPVLHNNNVQWIVQSATSGVRSIWAHGIAGQGEIVNNTDSGINTSHYQHRSGSSAIGTWGVYPSHNAIVAYDSGAPSNIVFGDGAGASYHGTHTVCTECGDDTILGSSSRDGVAKKARVYFNDCGDNTSTSIYTYGDLNDLYIRPYDKYYTSDGIRAYISSNSWGSAVAGAYTATSMTSDQFMWAHKDFLLCFSAGNSGPGSQTIGAPASAKSVVTVGGCGNNVAYQTIYGLGSRGPCADGRMKPTIITPGNGVSSATLGTSTYQTKSGTSMACPSAAGSAALIRQYLREGWYPTGTPTASDAFSFISASLLKAMLVNSADNDISSYTAPGNNIGWGRVDLDSVLYFSGEDRKLMIVDNTVGMLTGEQVDYHFNIPSGASNLKITLGWTDYPGNPAVTPQIVNDLNLSAHTMFTFYHGNQYSGEYSVANPSGWDDLNVVECIRVSSPPVGDWRVTVTAPNVPYGPQPFSLVISYTSGAVTGFVSIDKPVYRANDLTVDTVRVRIEDLNYGSASSIDYVPAVLRSVFIETQPETVWCEELGVNSYVFEGELPLLFHKPVHSDGRLSVCQDDTIKVTYEDESPSYTSSTWGSVDSRYFMITDVHCEEISAFSAEVCWTTNDNANSTVCYGTNPGNLNDTVSVDTPYCTPHRMRVSGLSEKTLYYYDVASEDFRGNKVCDDNGGQHYTFTTDAGGAGTDVLVVVLNNDLQGEEFAHPGFLQDALDAGGWTYNWWSTKDNGTFTRNQLKEYKAVYFQVGQENYPPWTVAQKETIKLYHDGGARFAVTGHDIGWAPWYAPYASADSVFCKNYLHYRYIGDITSTSWNTLYGISGDPISGSYTGGVQYDPFRDGAAADSVRLSGTGAPGTGSYVWHGSAANDSCGIRWESQDDMGSPGNGVWGGQKTRVVSNAFEITQIDTAYPGSSARVNILNNMFIWLIGHDHPDVSISSPVGGMTYNSSPVSIAWSASAYGGASIDWTWIEYSPDAGQTWYEILAGPGITSPYAWDVSSLTDGARYQVRIIVSDQGVYPSMKGADQTTDFTISVGNDYLGPKVLPQSIDVQDNPMIVTSTDTLLPFDVIISDSLTGMSTLAGGQWFILGFGTFPLFPDDGAWDEIQEGAHSSIRFTYIPGNTRICTLSVRGRDAAIADQNWGNWYSRTFTLIDGVPVGIGVKDGQTVVPLMYAFSAPLPNPFRITTSFMYAVPCHTQVTIKVYNCAGQLVKTLVDTEVKPGLYTTTWHGTDNRERTVASGIYFVQYVTPEFLETKKVILVR